MRDMERFPSRAELDERWDVEQHDHLVAAARESEDRMARSQDQRGRTFEHVLLRELFDLDRAVDEYLERTLAAGQPEEPAFGGSVGASGQAEHIGQRARPGDR